MNIKEIRNTTGLSQRSFSKMFNIPISSGADAKSVSEILGHSNVNITLNRYVHPNLETKRSAINSIVIP